MAFRKIIKGASFICLMLIVSITLTGCDISSIMGIVTKVADLIGKIFPKAAPIANAIKDMANKAPEVAKTAQDILKTAEDKTSKTDKTSTPPDSEKKTSTTTTADTTTKTLDKPLVVQEPTEAKTEEVATDKEESQAKSPDSEE